MAKGLKLKVSNFWALILSFVEVTVEKLVEGEIHPAYLMSLEILVSLVFFFFFFFFFFLFLSLVFYLTKVLRRCLRIIAPIYHI